MDQYIIELADLTKKYGSFTAVDHLNLTISRGEIYGLLGPNGAGKSTAILMMLGLTEPTSGSVKVCGINSTTNPIKVKRKVGYLPEDVGFYDDYTGLENLIFTAMLNGDPKNLATRKAEQLLSRVGLAGEAGKKAGKYSRGMRQRLGLADVLIKDPEVIILDEPTLGIDPKGVQDILGFIQKLSIEEGHTILLSSHQLHQVQEICGRVGLFVQGRLIAEGDINSLSQKLFSEEPYIIEAGVSLFSPDNSNPLSDLSTAEHLTSSIKAIQGVQNAELKNNVVRIGCSQDITNEIAMTIVRAGFGLLYITKKDFGLNDIYNRYFEGADNHEQNNR